MADPEEDLEKNLFGDEEEDLFGSDEEVQAGTPGVAGDGSGTASSSNLPPGSATQSIEEQGADDFPDEDDLFGSDDEAQDTAGAGTGDDERDLFGSDDEGPAEPDASVAPPTSPPARTPSQRAPSEADLSEMDERDIFGDISDEELPEKIEDVIIRNRPKPDLNRNSWCTVRLPNVLSFEKKPFKPYTEKNLTDAFKVGFQESENTMSKEVIKLMNPDNVMRWRFQRDDDGNVKYASNGRPLYESNARLVEWEDGTKTLHIGKEPFNVSEISESALLYEENSRDIHVCHGEIGKRMIPMPVSLKSESHDMLKVAQFRKYMPKSRTRLMDIDVAQRLSDAERNKEVQMSPSKRPRIAPGDKETGLTAAWLEEDEPSKGEGESLKDIKKQMK